MKPISLSTIVSLLCLAIAGCPQTTVLGNLEKSVAVTELLVATLAATGKIPTDTAASIEAALVYLPPAFEQTTAELASTDAVGVKASKISTYFVTALNALNALPQGAKVWTDAVVKSISIFLSSLESTTTKLTAARVSAPADKTTLDNLNQRIAALAWQTRRMR